jgi:archaellum component FlaC
LHLSDLANLAYPVILLLGGVAGYWIFRSTYAKADNELKEDLITTRGQKIEDLQKDVEALKKRDDEQQKLIDNLSRELNIWRDLPIKQLSDDYHKLAEAVTAMTKILETLAKDNKVGPTRRK